MPRLATSNNTFFWCPMSLQGSQQGGRCLGWQPQTTLFFLAYYVVFVCTVDPSKMFVMFLLTPQMVQFNVILTLWIFLGYTQIGVYVSSTKQYQVVPPIHLRYLNPMNIH